VASQGAENLKSDDAGDALRIAIAICSLHCHLDACLNSGALREETDTIIVADFSLGIHGTNRRNSARGFSLKCVAN
jgi:hypothetical protein